MLRRSTNNSWRFKLLLGFCVCFHLGLIWFGIGFGFLLNDGIFLCSFRFFQIHSLLFENFWTFYSAHPRRTWQSVPPVLILVVFFTFLDQIDEFRGGVYIKNDGKFKGNTNMMFLMHGKGWKIIKIIYLCINLWKMGKNSCFFIFSPWVRRV